MANSNKNRSLAVAVVALVTMAVRGVIASIPRRMISAASHLAVTMCRQTSFPQPVSVIWTHKSPKHEGLSQTQPLCLYTFLKIATEIAVPKNDFSDAKDACS